MGVNNLFYLQMRKMTVLGPSDEALVAGLAIGDGDATVAFVRRFQRRVFGMAFSVVGDRGTAEDVSQEAFVRAWRHAGAYDARRGSVATWLLTITHNLAVDAVRVRRPSPVGSIDLALFERASHGISPESAAATSADMVRVAQAVSELSEEQRRALVLARFHGFTAAQVSEYEAIPLGTAKTRIRQAVLRLAAVLQTEDSA